MKLGIWVWTTDYDYNTGYIENNDMTLPMSFAFSKIGDTNRWYRSSASVRDLGRIYTEQGIGQIPWYVGRGYDLDGAWQEGYEFGIRVAAHEGCGILDLEPYPDQYWQGIPGTATAFVNGFETGGGRELHLSPDARNPGINLDEWEILRKERPHLHIRYLPQAYWTEFRQNMADGIAAATTPLIGAGVPFDAIWPVLPTYYVHGPVDDPTYTPMSPDDMEAQLRMIASAGFPGVSLWRRGFLTREVADRINSMIDIFAQVVPPPPEPPPAPSDDLTQLLVVTRDQLAGALVTVQRAVDIVTGSK